MTNQTLENLVKNTNEASTIAKSFQDKPYDSANLRQYAASKIIADPNNPEAAGIAGEILGWSQEQLYEFLQEEVKDSQKKVIDYSKENFDLVLNANDERALVSLVTDPDLLDSSNSLSGFESYKDAIKSAKNKDINGMTEYLSGLIADGYSDTFKTMLNSEETVARMFRGVILAKKSKLLSVFANEQEGNTIDKSKVISYIKENVPSDENKAATLYLNVGVKAAEEQAA